MLNDGAPVPKDDGTIPDDKGAAAMVAATDIVAAAENDMDALQTLIVFSEIASKCTTFYFTETCLLCT